ncbi:hypothetical protein HPB51_002631 [Rhipicephalus microplus]|uniref:TRASH domain-containing protein n=1 Tax=Rhipicephalus microplus TaxID=6941 RepID=A0A9J6DF89_RHIMP|nr:hypothetical protein HPB51_002631 [Rhipicephalus microplus]
MDVEMCESSTANGELIGECSKDGTIKQPEDNEETKADDSGSLDETTLKNSSMTNGRLDAGATEEDDAVKSVNGTSESGTVDEGRMVEKPSSEGDVSMMESSSKGNSDALECGDSQQDSIIDEERTEPSELSEDFQLPDCRGSDSMKSKETNSEDSTSSSTPRRTLKKKSKKISKLSIMHAIAERLSGQAKGDVKGATKTEPKGDGESNASDITSEAMDERLQQDSKGIEDLCKRKLRGDFRPLLRHPLLDVLAADSFAFARNGFANDDVALLESVSASSSAVIEPSQQMSHPLFQIAAAVPCSETSGSASGPSSTKSASREQRRAHVAVTAAYGIITISTADYRDARSGKLAASAVKPGKVVHGNSDLLRPKRICVQCHQCVEATEQKPTFLVWETMEFCAEECLRKYQSANGSHCSHCHSSVNQLSLGKYCVRFGADIRQFCSGKCLEEFKRGLKVCCLCQKDLTKQVEGFLAPVGDKGHFKDFCSQECLERYERMNAFNAGNLVAHKCSACNAESTTKYQVDFNDASHRLCSDTCVSKFRYAKKIKMVVCENCHKLYDNAADKCSSLYYDNVCLQFCTKACVNLFVLSHRKIVPCAWCKVKKYNFDMIERVESAATSHLFCSLNCVNLFRVNQNASSARIIRCDFCFKSMPAQYHLTMSDASIRNFCSYKCVITFQNQFKNLPLLTTSSPTVPPTAAKGQVAAEASGTPVITNIRSLAPTTVVPTSMQSASEMSTSSPNVVRTPPTLTAMPKVLNATVLTPSNSTMDAAPKVVTRAPSIAVSSTATAVSLPVGTTSNTLALAAPSAKDATTVAAGKSEREVIIQLPFPKLLRNKAVLCRPQMVTKAAFCRPVPCHKETQSDGRLLVTRFRFCFHSQEFLGLKYDGTASVLCDGFIEIALDSSCRRNSAVGVGRKVKLLRSPREAATCPRVHARSH